jgi:hypothetical protein
MVMAKIEIVKKKLIKNLEIERLIMKLVMITTTMKNEPVNPNCVTLKTVRLSISPRNELDARS